jgi:hypothetical protein
MCGVLVVVVSAGHTAARGCDSVELPGERADEGFEIEAGDDKTALLAICIPLHQVLLAMRKHLQARP